MSFIKKYDVFVSYAIEDKESVAKKIMADLEKKGVRTYFAGNELKVGDPISEVIYRGLKKSRFAILVISPDYVRRWPTVESSRFIERELEEKQGLIFPVWHKITMEDVIKVNPLLAERFALSTDIGIEAIAENIFAQIQLKKRRSNSRIALRVSFVLLVAALAGIVFANIFRRVVNAHSLPEKSDVDLFVLKRISDFQNDLDNNLMTEVRKKKGKAIRPSYIIDSYNNFIRMGNHEQKEYGFSNGWASLTGRNKIIATGIRVSDAPYNNYNLCAPQAWLIEEENDFGRDTVFELSFAISSQSSVRRTVDTVFFVGKKAHARVTYQNYLRVVYGSYNYRTGTDHRRKQSIRYLGLKPTEEYVFEFRNQQWNLGEIK